MLAAILSRLLRMVVVMFGISVITFLIFFATPSSDPAARIAGKNAAQETIEAVRKDFGLDRPLYVQYGLMMQRLFISQDLTSFANRGQKIIPTVMAAAPATLSLVSGAAVLWMLGGILTGITAAAFRGRWPDKILMGLSMMAVAMPVFWVGEMVNLVTQNRLHDTWAFSWVPALGYTPFSQDPGLWFRSMVFPWLTLAFLYIGLYGRMLRTGIIETYQEDFIRTARAKGLTGRKVLLKHATRSAIIPIVIMFGMDFGVLVGGAAVLTEVVFGINGVGRLTYQALKVLDLPMIMATVLYASFFVVIANAVVDLLCLLIDPRMRRA
ncbi:ABC transporter permease [Pseudogemmobacter blasticus]|uniref:Peptide ABC transporter permease n=1 Tax=Fuscovulum blasticum DSM 2131 TaxID=1188250 RepID=A0A2T4J976_FUSBL|nr:ABC transporter permease [Fuscovulum blasticum]AWD22354.1 peptide ABC transporter permease [Fuscovulum blasticum]PTE14449.1 peptide ABC transporter permease [Fuscovulum blasticum DSM 2131]